MQIKSSPNGQIDYPWFIAAKLDGQQSALLHFHKGSNAMRNDTMEMIKGKPGFGFLSQWCMT